MKSDHRKDKAVERKKHKSELLDYIQSNLRHNAAVDLGEPTLLTAASGGGGGKADQNLAAEKPAPSKSAKFNIDYKFLDRKTVASVKRNIGTKLESCDAVATLAMASGPPIQVLPVPLAGHWARVLAGFLDFEDKSKFEASVQNIFEGVYGSLKQCKEIVSEICDELRHLRFDKGFSCTVLYAVDTKQNKTIVKTIIMS